MGKNYNAGIRPVHVVAGITFVVLCLVGVVRYFADKMTNFSWPEFWSTVLFIIIILLFANAVTKE